MVKILSDSTCDLSQELAKQYGIEILPLHVLLGDEDHRDGVDITPSEIFAWSDEHKSTPKTAAPSWKMQSSVLGNCLRMEMK